jgi:hypothetical protein
MRYLFKFHVLLLLLSQLSVADEERYGFLNLVNLIPSGEACHIRLAGKTLIPKGLKAAAETGWFMVPAGKHSVIISHASHETLKSDLTVTEGRSDLLIIYLAADKPVATDDKPRPPEIRLTSLPAYDSEGFALKAVSMFPGKSRFQLGRQFVELEPLTITPRSNWTGGGFQINHQGQSIGVVSRGRDRASHYLLLGTDHQEKYLTAIVNADIQKLPPWMKPSR